MWSARRASHSSGSMASKLRPSEGFMRERYSTAFWPSSPGIAKRARQMRRARFTRARRIEKELATPAEDSAEEARHGEDDVAMRDRLGHFLLQPLRPQE